MRFIQGTTTIASGASVSSSVSLSPAVAPSNTIVFFTYRGGNSSPADTTILPNLASDGSSITWSRSTTNGGTITISYTLIESTIFSVQRFSGTFTGTTANIALSPSIDTTKSFPILYLSAPSGGGTYSDDDMLRVSLGSTQATLDCSISSTGTPYNLQVVSSDIFSVQTQPFSFSGNVSSTRDVTFSNAVDTAKSFPIITHLGNSTNNLRMGEKLLSARLTSTTNVRVERQIITATISGICYLVSVSGAASVTASGLYTFANTTTPSSPANPWNIPGVDNTKSVPIICGSPNFWNTNNVTSDDIVQACNTTAIASSDGAGGTNVSFQRTSSSGTASLYAVLLYLPDSLEGTTYTLSGSSNGVGSEGGSVATYLTAIGSSLGIGEDVAQGQIIAALQGSSQGIGNEGGGPTAFIAISGSSLGVGSEGDSLSQASTLQGSSQGIGSESSLMAQAATLQGSTIGVSLESSSLRASLKCQGSSQGLGGESSSLVLSAALGGFSPGVGQSYASFNADTILILYGSSNGKSLSFGGTTSLQNLSGDSLGSSLEYSALNATASLQGGSQGLGGSESTSSLLTNLLGDSKGLSEGTGSLDVALSLAGSSDGQSLSDGMPYLTFGLSGHSQGSSDDFLTFFDFLLLSGHSGGTSKDSGRLTFYDLNKIDLSVPITAGFTDPLEVSFTIIDPLEIDA